MGAMILEFGRAPEVAGGSSVRWLALQTSVVLQLFVKPDHVELGGNGYHVRLDMRRRIIGGRHRG